jgi:L-threonylcarbamoyladenylate synthase
MSRAAKCSAKDDTVDDTVRESILAQALVALRDEGLVVYPTETFYAVGADACSERALSRLFALKRREGTKAVALIMGELDHARQVAREIPSAARRLADQFWPGPLTIVLPALPSVSPLLVGPTGGVGVRVSSHPVARALALGLGRPLTATSANLSGEAPARTLAQAKAALGLSVDVYVDGGHLSAEFPSTVVAFEQGALTILRRGAISEESLHAALSD